MTRYSYVHTPGEVCPVFRTEPDRRTIEEKVGTFMRNQELIQRFLDEIMPECRRKNAERHRKLYGG